MWRRDVKQAVHRSIIVIALALYGCQTLQYDQYDEYNKATAAEKAGDYVKAAELYHSVTDSDDFEFR